MERDNYQSPHGTIYQREIWSVKTPKTWEEMSQFFTHLREKGGDTLEKSFITINNKKLLSYVQTEIETREQEGNLDTTVPGIQPPTKFVDLGMRRA
jgi:hypothetical protein